MTSEVGVPPAGESISARNIAAQFFRAQAVELGERIIRTEEKMGAPGAMIPAVDRKGVSSGKYQSQKQLFYDFAIGIQANDDEAIQRARIYLTKEVRKIEAESERLKVRLAGSLADDDKFEEYGNRVEDLRKAAYRAADDQKYKIGSSQFIAEKRLLSTQRFKLQSRLARLVNKAKEYGDVLGEL